MHNVLAVKILHRLEESLDYFSSLIFWQASRVGPIIEDLIKEFSPILLFGENMDVVFILVTVDHFHNSRMVNGAK